MSYETSGRNSRKWMPVRNTTQSIDLPNTRMNTLGQSNIPNLLLALMRLSYASNDSDAYEWIADASPF